MNTQRVIANYFGWLMIEESLGWLDEKSQKLFYDLQKILCRSTLHQKGNGCDAFRFAQDKPKWQECVEALGFNNPLIINNPEAEYVVPAASLYIRKKFDKTKKEKVEALSEAFRQELYKIVKNAKWMGKETQNSALNTVKTMKHEIAFPPEILNKTLMNKYYKGVIFFRDSNYVKDMIKRSVPIHY